MYHSLWYFGFGFSNSILVVVVRTGTFRRTQRSIARAGARDGGNLKFPQKLAALFYSKQRSFLSLLSRPSPLAHSPTGSIITTMANEITHEAATAAPTTTAPSTWTEWNDRGRAHFQRGAYKIALDCFTRASCAITMNGNNNNNNNATQPASTSLQQAILYSNTAACHLQLQNPHAAVTAAQHAIRIHVSYANAHVRLASAYLQLSSSQSNQACQALQTALRYAPGHVLAKQLLREELQSRDGRNRENHHRHHHASTTCTTTGTDSNDEGEDSDNVERTNAGSTNAPRRPTPNSRFEHPIALDDDHPTGFWNSLSDTARGFQNVSPQYKRVLWGLGLYLLLYISFGGRFGLASSRQQQQQQPAAPPTPASYYHTTYHRDDPPTHEIYRTSTKQHSDETWAAMQYRDEEQQKAPSKESLQERAAMNEERREQQQQRRDTRRASDRRRPSYDDYDYRTTNQHRRRSDHRYSRTSDLDWVSVVLVLIGAILFARSTGTDPVVMMGLWTMGVGRRRRGGFGGGMGGFGGGMGGFGHHLRHRMRQHRRGW